MYQLIYKSWLQADVSWEAIIEIAQQARKNNAEQQVTGMLIMHKGEVLQILEGGRQQLSRLFIKISNDPRHDQIELMQYQPITSRHFEHWKMKEVEISRLPHQFCATIELLLQANNGRLPEQANQAEALLIMVAAITSDS